MLISCLIIGEDFVILKHYICKKLPFFGNHLYWLIFRLFPEKLRFLSLHLRRGQSFSAARKALEEKSGRGGFPSARPFQPVMTDNFCFSKTGCSQFQRRPRAANSFYTAFGSLAGAAERNTWPACRARAAARHSQRRSLPADAPPAGSVEKLIIYGFF